jgi:hypothetical protein
MGESRELPAETGDWLSARRQLKRAMKEATEATLKPHLHQ